VLSLSHHVDTISGDEWREARRLGSSAVSSTLIVGTLISGRVNTLIAVKSTAVRRGRPLEVLGEAIRRYRTERGLSQEKLAELADLNRNYLGEVERGERNVAAINILRICRGLEITPSELFASFTPPVMDALDLATIAR
jgi:DNA-binding XRE family transcriptional regulator